MAEEFWIEIAQDGNVTVEGKSAELGADCKALTKEIEQALGTVTSEVMKPEFHRPKKVLRKA